jgi:GNAT superfamily N-acetyltransferase
VNYHVRLATLADADILVRQRLGMFSDMGVPAETSREYGPQFRAWLNDMMPAGVYRGWLVESQAGTVVAGGGLTVLPWPPGPRSHRGRLAFVNNVYTEPEFRRQGHARRIMETIHAWCRHEGISSIGLNASQFGQGLYESMGYQVTDSPMMFLTLA